MHRGSLYSHAAILRELQINLSFFDRGHSYWVPIIGTERKICWHTENLMFAHNIKESDIKIKASHKMKWMNKLNIERTHYYLMGT